MVILEELAANDLSENLTLQALQNMPMSQRRHATIILLGSSFQTFYPAAGVPAERPRGYQQLGIISSNSSSRRPFVDNLFFLA